MLGTLLDCKLAELAYEDGMTLDQATRDIRARHFAERPVAAISAPVMLSAAIVAAHRAAVSDDMARKIEGTGKCMLAFRGDMPLELFMERENLLSFLIGFVVLPGLTARITAATSIARSASSPTSMPRSPRRTSSIARSSKK